MKLDMKRDHGIISPPYLADGCDRAAHYEQDGRLFDSHGILIVPGVAAVNEQPKPAVVARQDAPVPKVDVSALSAQELLERADELSFTDIANRAKEIFDGAIIIRKSGGKNGLVASIKAAMKAAESRSKKQSSAGLTWDAMTSSAPDVEEADEDVDDIDEDEDQEEFEPDPPPPPPKGMPKADVDLAAWARGKDYLFDEVRRTIRAAYNRQVTDRGDALEFLIEQRVVPAAEARRDV